MSNFVQVIKTCENASKVAAELAAAYEDALAKWKTHGRGQEPTIYRVVQDIDSELMIPLDGFSGDKKPDKPSGPKAIIRHALAQADETAKKLIFEAMNPYRVFGVKKFDMPQGEVKAGLVDLGDPFEGYFTTLNLLAARELTGNAARQAIHNALADFPLADREYYSRIIDKDLRAGFSADTFNEVFKNVASNTVVIPVFDVQLAAKCEDTSDFETKVTFPCLAEFKLDGERTIAIVRSNSITYLSRSGKEAFHVAGLFDDELRIIHRKLGYDFILDGERYAGNFTETVNAKKSGNDEAKANLRFYAYFLMPLTDWIAKQTNVTMRDARAMINSLVTDLNLEKITQPKQRIVANYDEMMAWCNEAIDVHGVEGLILKDFDAVYEWDRTFAWTKVKRFYDADLQIVGFYAGKAKGRLENTLGGIYAAGWLEDGRFVLARIGSGWSDVERDEMWNNQELYLGKTVIGWYQEVSQGAGKKYLRLRFNSVKDHKWRDDKVVDVSDTYEFDPEDFK